MVCGIHSWSSGFSLTELLVVVAIIAILATLLMPAIALVRNTASQTNCLSNLRQYGIASLTYAADNDGYAPQIAQYMPSPTDAYIHAGGRYAWDTCRDYGLERSDQASCPTTRRLLGQPPSSSMSSYNYNEPVGGVGNLVPTGDGTQVWIQSANIAQVSRPSEVILFSEVNVIFSVAQNSNWSLRRNFRDILPNGTGNYDHAAVVHRVTATPTGANGLANYVAADGHAQGITYLKPAAGATPRWPGTRVVP